MKNLVVENVDLNIDSELFSPLSSEEKKAEKWCDRTGRTTTGS